MTTTREDFLARSLTQPLDFRSFLEWKREATSLFPEAVDLSETRLARALAPLVPSVAKREGAIHRCDLGRRWLEVRGVDVDPARARVCAGVRAALHGLFAAFAQQRVRVAIPHDVYPVYDEIAQRVGLPYTRFGSFPSVDLAHLLELAGKHHITHLLLPYPLKLHGRAWTPQEVEAALRWLRGCSTRRLVLDGVYSFGMPLAGDVGLRELIETDQVLYLDSLSKGWLHGWVMGVALLPEQDLYALAPALHPPVETGDPHTAAALLQDHPWFPRELVSSVDARRAVLLDRIRDAGLSALALPVDRGYFVPVNRTHAELLRTYGIIGLPCSVFGGAAVGWSLLSAL